MENKNEPKLRVVKSKCLAGALVWLGFEYKKDNDDNFVFERNYIFDLAWRDLHAMRQHYYKLEGANNDKK